MSCKYCNYEERIYDDENEFDYIWINDACGCLNVEMDGGRELVFEINYCPICGRKLGDSDD